MTSIHPVYRTPGQRLARVLHGLKAQYRAKERARVSCLSTLFEPGAVVLDVGAHFGYFAKEFCQVHRGQCTVHCFEPLNYNYTILRRVMKRFTNARLHNIALSGTKGTADIHVPIKKSGKIGPGLAHLGVETNRDYASEPISVTTLDAWAAENQLESLDFIKCDIEGAELPMLRGATQAIDRYRPVLFIEVAEPFTPRMGYEPDHLFEFLYERGYEKLQHGLRALLARRGERLPRHQELPLQKS